MLLAKEAASKLLHARVKPKENAYQFFISASFAEESARHPSLSLSELTAQILAPKWNSLTSDERAPFEEMAMRDAKRWEREHQQAQISKDDDPASRAVLESVKCQADVVENGHLSGQGLFAAANFDPRAGPQNSEAIVRLWTQLDDAQQRPWKEKALANQKKFAMRALTKPPRPASSKSRKRHVTRTEEDRNEE